MINIYSALTSSVESRTSKSNIAQLGCGRDSAIPADPAEFLVSIENDNCPIMDSAVDAIPRHRC